MTAQIEFRWLATRPTRSSHEFTLEPVLQWRYKHEYGQRMTINAVDEKGFTYAPVLTFAYTEWQTVPIVYED